MGKVKFCPCCNHVNPSSSICCDNCGEDLISVREEVYAESSSGLVEEKRSSFFDRRESDVLRESAKPGSAPKKIVRQISTPANSSSSFQKENNYPAKDAKLNNHIADGKPASTPAKVSGPVTIKMGAFSFELTEEPISFSRMSKNNNIYQELGKNKLVSREHMQAFLDSKKSYIQDLGSTNGTYLNGNRLEPHKPREIFPGDVITLCSPNTNKQGVVVLNVVGR